MKIIGLFGEKGSGKSFLAEVIRKHATNFSIPGGDVICDFFAAPIKEYCVRALGIDHRLTHGNDDDKNTPTRYAWESMPPSVRERPGNAGKTGFMTIRHVMQVVGTELGRDIWGQDVWTRAMKSQMDAYSTTAYLSVRYWVITDGRFDNEADAVHEWGGEVWLVDGSSRIGARKKDQHSSENVSVRAKADLVIENTPQDTPETLWGKIKHRFDN